MTQPQPAPQPVTPPIASPAPTRAERLPYILVDTPTRLTRALVWLHQQKSLALDCEATGLDPVAATPLLLQLGNEDGQVIILDLTRLCADALAPLWPLLAQRLIIGHNLNYDYRLLKSHYPAVRFPRVYDTQLAEQVLTCGHYDKKGSWLSQLSLAALTQKYLGITLDKSARLSFTESVKTFDPTPEQLTYAARDVAVLPQIVEQQTARLVQEGLLRAVKLRFEALVPLAEVEMRGMLINQESWRAFLDETRRDRAQVETDLRVLLQPAETEYRLTKYEREARDYAAWERARDQELAACRAEYERTGGGDPHTTGFLGWGAWKIRWMKQWREERPNPGKPHLNTDPINLSSPEQMLRAYQFAGLRVEKTDKMTRERLLLAELAEEQRQLVTLHQQHSLLAHIESSFGENILDRVVPTTGRLHTHLNIGLTATGRMSSESPNFQNMPSSDALRHSFVADPGTYVLTADFSGQELAIAAALSQCHQMMDDLEAGRDLYKELAVMVWGGTVETVTKEQRKKAKSGLLGINYGLGVPGLMNRHHMSKHDAQAVLDAIKARYHELVAWGDQQAFYAKRAGYVETASGARRYFPNIAAMGWKASTETRNAPIQGTAADIIYRCAARLERHLVPLGIRPVNYVHDEVVCLVPSAITPARATALVETEMTEAFYDLMPYDRYHVRVRVDMHTGPWWTKD